MYVADEIGQVLEECNHLMFLSVFETSYLYKTVLHFYETFAKKQSNFFRRNITKVDNVSQHSVRLDKMKIKFYEANACPFSNAIIEVV